jgi:hypothetical protein
MFKEIFDHQKADDMLQIVFNNRLSGVAIFFDQLNDFFHGRGFVGLE